MKRYVPLIWACAAGTWLMKSVRDMERGVPVGATFDLIIVVLAAYLSLTNQKVISEASDDRDERRRLLKERGIK